MTDCGTGRFYVAAAFIPALYDFCILVLIGFHYLLYLCITCQSLVSSCYMVA